MALHRSLRRSNILEVERKFRGLAVSELTQHGGVPSFQNLRQLPMQTIHDTYYDHDNILSAAGAWVRLRNGVWQAKISKGGGFLNSRFEEFYGAQDIADRVRHITGWDLAETKESENFGLLPLAEFETRRRAWTANSDFQIVLDSMDFGHEVGEVELQHTLTFDIDEESEAAHEKRKAQVMQQMDERIVDFMRTYSWAFAPEFGSLDIFQNGVVDVWLQNGFSQHISNRNVFEAEISGQILAQGTLSSARGA
ncbi:adenylate cyclase [Grosmannia clavigera kw1407]|uniref:Thiamine-triphosphatase n=1 Tax=Grosmannia clavigera (strain kw1407 / UAMH 11150) TaxID=655863 RepID=F0XKM5_GROCL|nr:adenylate cyclase [Grosmannia clavigera kw1407]EFX01723.1 adenylate cyclase [Grosmannia clavigera kw1407]